MIGLLIFGQVSSQQRWARREMGEEPNVTVGVLVDYSPIQQNEFNNVGVHVGMWAYCIGVFGGMVESRPLDSLQPRKAVFTVATRLRMFDKKLVISPFYAVGTSQFQDIGARAGWQFDQGINVGLMFHLPYQGHIPVFNQILYKINKSDMLYSFTIILSIY